jgi:hypothetical protein
MPTRPITVRRWQVVVAFVLLASSFAIAVAIGTNAQTRANHASKRAAAAALKAEATAAKADRAAAGVRSVQERLAGARTQQLAQLHAYDVRSCAARHKTVTVLDRILDSSIVSTQKLLAGPPTGLLRDALIRGIALDRRAKKELRAADCFGVPPLPKSPSVKPKKST